MRKNLRRIISSTLAATLVFTSVTLFPEKVEAANSATIGKTVWSGVNSADWMANIDGDTQISAINIPGTHDSTTQYVDTSDYSKCQGSSIAEQLQNGIRFLDIRLEADTSTGTLYCMHAAQKCYEDSGKKTRLDLQKVLDSCYAFLDAHPTETIVMSMKKDNGTVEDSQVESYIHNYINKNSGRWWLTNGSPTLDQVRNKIVLVRRYHSGSSNDYANDKGVRIFWSDQSGSNVASIPWDGPTKVTQYGWTQFCVQDRYEYSVSDKWDAIKKGLGSPPHTSNEQKKEGNDTINITPETTYFLNFMSAAPKGVLSIPSKPISNAETINANFLAYNNGSLDYGKHYGWTIMDFATEELARHVFESNSSPTLEAKLEAEQKIAQTSNALNIPDTAELDLVLPTTGEAIDGAAGTSITWTCEPSNVLQTSGSNFRLVCPTSEDIPANLTATISYNGYFGAKAFTVTLKKTDVIFRELMTAINDAKDICNDPANAKYNTEQLSAAIQKAEQFIKQNKGNNSITAAQIQLVLDELNTVSTESFPLKSLKQLKKNLLGWYPLTSNSNDISGNQNNGAATGVTFSTKNGATFTDGGKKQSYISLPASMFNNREQLTISFWAKDTKADNNKSNTVFGFGSGTEPDGNNSPNVYKYMLINTNNSRKLKAVITKNTWRDEQGFKTECSFAANEWTHITCVIDGTNFTLYKNGALIGTKNTSVKLTDFGKNAIAYIGNSIWTNNDVDYNGSVKDFRIYGCPIDASQVAELYAYDNAVTSEHLIGWYPLTENSNDASGNKNHGTATGVTFSAENGATFTDSGKKKSIITLPTKMFNGKDQLTLSFFVKDTKADNNTSNTVFGFGSGTEPDGDNSPNVYKYLLINTNNNRNLKTVVTTNTWRDERGFKNTECSFPKDKWAHIVCVIDGTNLTLYKDRTRIDTKDTGIKLSDFGTNTVAYIGNSIWTQNDLDYSGSVRDFRIYDSVLSENDITDIYKEAVKQSLTSALTSSLPLDSVMEEDGSLSLYVTKDKIELPTSGEAVTISWQSSNTNVIDTNGNVALPDTRTEVTLTATITFEDSTTEELVFHCIVFERLDIDTTELNQLVSSVEETIGILKETNYTTSSWKALTNALAAAKAQILQPASNEAAANALSDLQAAKNNLAKLGDKTSLNALINNVKNYKKDDYTTSSWPSFETALTNANNAAASLDVTQTDVDNAKSALETAKNNLVKRGDKTSLNTAIANAKKLPQENYTTESWQSLTNVLNGTVKDVINNPDATEADISGAENALSTAVAGLVKITVTVTFNPDNGSEASTVPVDKGDKVTEPAKPVKDGYKFDGWFTEDSDTKFDFNTPITADITLTAGWTESQGEDEPTTYTVTFVFNDGTTADDTKTVNNGETVSEPTAPSRTGYTFDGWFTDDSETAFKFNTPITADITLTAKWTKVQGDDNTTTYTVTFNYDDGTTADDTQTVNSDETVSEPAPPTRTGYSFDGWFANGSDTSFDFSTPITADIVLTAKWTKNNVSATFTVTFNYNDEGATQNTTLNLNNGDMITKPQEPTRTGYTFDGWFADGSDTSFDFSTPITSDIVLTARWTQN